MKNMINGIKQKTIVGKNGKIEILSSELPEGIVVELIVLIESKTEENETTTQPSNPPILNPELC